MLLTEFLNSHIPYFSIPTYQIFYAQIMSEALKVFLTCWWLVLATCCL